LIAARVSLTSVGSHAARPATAAIASVMTTSPRRRSGVFLSFTQRLTRNATKARSIPSPWKEDRHDAGQTAETAVSLPTLRLGRGIPVVQNGPGEEETEAEEESGHDHTEGHAAFVMDLPGALEKRPRRLDRAAEESEKGVPCQDLDHGAYWSAANGSDLLKIRGTEESKFAISDGTVKGQLCLGKPVFFARK
jgi:hypothetical protein